MGHALYLDMVVVFRFHPDEKSTICRVHKNKQNHDLYSILSFIFGGFPTFAAVTSHLPITTPTSAVYVEFHLLKGNPSVYFT